MVIRKCEYCEKTFETKNSRKLCCSEFCRYERHLKICREYAVSKKTQRKEYKTKWREENEIYDKSKKAKWYDENKEITKQRSKEWRKNNSEAYKEYSRKKRQEDKHKTKIRVQHKHIPRDFCRVCGSKENLNLHHIDYSGDVDKTIVLCNVCHFNEHKKQWRKELILGDLK